MPVLPGTRICAAVIAVDWGPVGVWVSAAITLLAVIVTALVALGFFDYLRGDPGCTSRSSRPSPGVEAPEARTAVACGSASEWRTAAAEPRADASVGFSP